MVQRVKSRDSRGLERVLQGDQNFKFVAPSQNEILTLKMPLSQNTVKYAL